MQLAAITIGLDEAASKSLLPADNFKKCKKKHTPNDSDTLQTHDTSYLKK